MPGATLEAKFDTRRAADMAIERMVQEVGIDRSAIFVAPAGTDNSVGVAPDGADAKAGDPATEARDDADLGGPVTVSVDLDDDTRAAAVQAAFAEFEASPVA